LNDEYFETYGYPLFCDDIREYWEDWRMAKITNEQIYTELKGLRIVLLGVEGTKDTGLYGEVKDMKKLQKEINGTVKSDHAWLFAVKWVVMLLTLALIGVMTGYIGLW